MASSTATTLRQAVPGLARTLRRFGPHLRRQRLAIAGGSTALLLEILLRLAEPWPLKFIIDTVVAPIVPAGSGEPGIGAGGPPGGWNVTTVLAVSAVALVAITGLRALASYLCTIAFAVAGNRVLTEVRAELYGHLQRLSLAFHHRSRTGDLLTRITGDVGRLQEVTVTAALPLAGNAITLVGMAVVMAVVDWRLALVAAAAFPIFAFVGARATRSISGVARSQRRQEGELASVASEALGAMTVVQAYSLENALEDRFAVNNNKSLREGVKAKRLSAGLERRTDVLVAVATGAVLFLGAQRVLSGHLSPGDLVLFVTYLKQGFKPLRDVAKYTGRLAKASASGERIIDLLDTEVDIRDRSWARPAPAFRGDVRFAGVTFAHEPGRPVLHDLDLHVHPGQRVGVIGPSGAGKSSLMGLLLRLYDPDEGAVLIDGHPLTDLTLASVRSQVAVVLQESVLFATSVRENIAYGDPDATDAEIEAAARLANAHEFVSELPKGYDTVVGERGATLSGGQRQRLAIARAAVRRAPIVILDEAMTGLDAANEAEVTEALRRLTAGRTTFLISHDPATVADADVVVRLQAGRVVARGRPEEVLGRRGRVVHLPRTEGTDAHPGRFKRADAG
ncbi:MAG: ABC transporter ATP-binding protein/permease [Actinobacteria bacterium]|nr:ABC transporter ATP-binding protein/permease [Actinomycetota bacterium]